MTQITVCGGGNAAQTLVALLGHQGIEVGIFTPLADEADALQTTAAIHGIGARTPWGDLHGRPAFVTANAQQAATESDIVLLAVPAFAQEPLLRALAPHLRSGTLICAMPARGGFDWAARDILAERQHDVILCGLQTLPWACRIEIFGRQVRILGRKQQVQAAVQPVDVAQDIAFRLSHLLDVPVDVTCDFLALTLANTGQLLHPGIMYGLLHSWDGVLWGEDEIPLFYQGVDEETAQLLQEMSDEVQVICHALTQQLAGRDLNSVRPLREWLILSYGDQIGDPSSLRTCLTTNRAFTGLRVPVTLIEENAYAPWFASRYLTEDVPYGLLATRGIAALYNVHTPAIDQVISWAQEQLGQEWLAEGRLLASSLGDTRAPQRFGLANMKRKT